MLLNLIHWITECVTGIDHHAMNLYELTVWVFTMSEVERCVHLATTLILLVFTINVLITCIKYEYRRLTSEKNGGIVA